MKRVMNTIVAVLVLSISSAQAAQSQVVAVTTADDFESTVLQADKPVVVKFWATWCPSCKAMGPVFESIAQANSDQYDFVSVDVDQAKDLADQYNVHGIPSFVFFNGGKQVGNLVGEIKQESFTTSMKNFFE